MRRMRMRTLLLLAVHIRPNQTRPPTRQRHGSIVRKSFGHEVTRNCLPCADMNTKAAPIVSAAVLVAAGVALTLWRVGVKNTDTLVGAGIAAVLFIGVTIAVAFAR